MNAFHIEYSQPLNGRLALNAATFVWLKPHLLNLLGFTFTELELWAAMKQDEHGRQVLKSLGLEEL